MNRARIIFYSVFAAYHAIAFIFTIWMGSTNSGSSLLGVLKYLGWFKWITLLGLLMVIADFTWLWLDSRNHKRELDAARVENNTLKAKVYDYQEAAKATPEVKTPR